MFIVGKFPGNESFKKEIASLFSDLYLFHFSEFVRKKLLKAFATVFFLSFSFPMFTSVEGTFSIECILLVSFFILFYVVFVLLSDYAISLPQNCFFSSLITFFLEF